MSPDPDRALVTHLIPQLSRDQLLIVADLLACRPTAQGQPPITIVHVGAHPLDGASPPYSALAEAGLARVVGFEPQREALTQLQATAGPHHYYLPHAVGDGLTHQLRTCHAAGFSSLFEPDPHQLALLTDFPRLAAVTDRNTVATQRLDDLTHAYPDLLDRIDLLLLDVQGSEAMILQHARQTLHTLLAVQVEVAFTRLYQQAPTFADVDSHLRAAGLFPHAFVSVRTWPMAPTPWADPLQHSTRHLIEADLLYTIDLTTLAHRTTDDLTRLALLSIGVYHSLGPALACMSQLRERHHLTDHAMTQLRELLTGTATPASQS